jgi:UDP-N-acetylmuramoyl-L-alanyl-D-glutamate--2,6-diaminopimelate ligase
MRLKDLIKGVAVDQIQGDPDTEISGMAYDSRRVRPGDVFVALKGGALDGHDFIPAAIEKGAKALVVESDAFKGSQPPSVALIRVPNSRRALSELSVRYHDRPFRGMDLVGITGTNGKTTTSYLLESILLAAGRRPGVIGTINYRMPGHIWRAPVTTPESLDLMTTLRQMADGGVTDVVMEVSSHALDQGRTQGCPFRVAVFTNISRDHLDYHPNMDAYFEAKSRLFKDLEEKGAGDPKAAIINTDDPRGRELVSMTKVPVTTYGLDRSCQVRADGLGSTWDGLTARITTPWGNTEIRSPLIGAFNIYNVLAASAAALSMGVDLQAVSSGIENLFCVPGRLEPVKTPHALSVVVDYAHTPDALQNALEAVKPLVRGRLITVFGCGGDRDRGKRSEMGRVAAENSDLAIVTSDNPRTEDPAAIVSQIEAGVRLTGLKKLSGPWKVQPDGRGYYLEMDRARAIRMAVRTAREGDVVVIAGKGHEDYQIIGTEKRFFDDRQAVAAAIREETPDAGPVG